jgi:membrane-associated phospholipid phosphatase
MPAMPTANPFIFPAPLWAFLTRLGEAQILVPAMLAVSVWLIWRGQAMRMALTWVLATGLTAFVTAATKIAFMGWEIGSAPLDFTGISGHAMFAAAILPLFARMAEGWVPLRWHHWPTAAGFALAGLVGVSRVAVQAHSWSEVIAGLVVGGAASAAVLILVHTPRLRVPVWMPAAVFAWLALGAHAAPPSPTHSWVAQVAMALSGHPKPYQRWQLHYHYRQEQRRRAAAAASQAAGRSDAP